MQNIMVRRFIYALVMILSFNLTGYAQEKIGNALEMDKIVHNFGDILLDSGPVSCEFTVKNTGDKPAVIYNVIS